MDVLQINLEAMSVESPAAAAQLDELVRAMRYATSETRALLDGRACTVQWMLDEDARRDGLAGLTSSDGVGGEMFEDNRTAMGYTDVECSGRHVNDPGAGQDPKEVLT